MDNKTDSPSDPAAEMLDNFDEDDAGGGIDSANRSADVATGTGAPTADNDAAGETPTDADASALISELNEALNAPPAADAADTFLDALASGAPEGAAAEAPRADDMAALALSMDDNLDGKAKPDEDAVYSLEEELKRMHEGGEMVAGKPDEAKPVKNEVKQECSTEEGKSAGVMKDSDLEEMLSADEVLQDPGSIKASQNEIKNLDVLVCGKCHEVFAFVEEFQKHKSQEACDKSQVIGSCEFESKPQIWGFVLWKNKQKKAMKGKAEEATGDWDMYKRWCLLGKVDRDAWVSAGQALQYYNKIGSAKLTEIKVHKVIKDDDKDSENIADSNKENSTFDTSKSPLIEVKRTVINKPKAVTTIQKLNDPNSNRAMRTMQTTKSEFAVERIVAKRFNPKKRTWEYQIKWEHFTSEENTWEPVANLSHCKQMVDDFEEQLKKLKAEKNKQAANMAKNSPKIRTVLTSPGSSSNLESKGLTANRPQRTSKQKALDQVKAWCGNISDEDGVQGLKRSRSPDSDDSFEKRLKFEENSDDSENEGKARVHYRKIAPKPTAQSPSIQVLKNGLGKNSPLPQNILIPDANGVVRINQKQLPSLSTGVYIMSKTAGIIKLDSNTSKVATSGGQTIVKVAPKIGQTHIKIMKKDGTSTQQIVQMSPKGAAGTPKIVQKQFAKAKKIVTDLKPSPIVKKSTDIVKKQPVILNKEIERKVGLKRLPDFAKKTASKSSGETSKEDESDDGLEELPFPEEIKVPETEEGEEPSEFILDPTTGKIAGVEYPDIPAPDPVDENKSDMTLDNIVKLAAADITEEDLKNDTMDVEPQAMEQEFEQKMKAIQKTEQSQEAHKRFVTASPSKQVVKLTVTPRKVAANPTSILNKALTGPQVIRRAVGAGTPRVQQRILNQSVARNPQSVNSVTRQVNTYVRTKPVAPKPRFNISSESKFVRTVHEVSPKNVYTYSRPIVQNSPTTKKIGSTTIRSSSMPVVNSPQQQQKTTTKLVRTSTGLVQRIVSSPMRKEQPLIVRGQPEKVERKIVQAKPKTVISMPSLMSDDELLLTAKATPQPKMKSVPMVEEPQMYHVDESANLAHEEPMTSVASNAQETQVLAANVNPDQTVAAALAPDMSSFTLTDNDNPIFITGDDGTVYQVAGQNEQGQTILLTQGSDGQQQCLLVTNEVAEAMETPVADETQQQQQQPQEISMPEISADVNEPLSVKTDSMESADQVVAQVVRAEPPSPGGTHKVVVMLPDGNLMVTQVSPEEYASLELE
ncbi:unnamed protein product [Phyllotreta striolata]|uniref:Chromo domain-containing protein n=1 Tax=Phyllotreta striolata TaxID=444603 RepID=A0A9N9XT71_PHYSR|nr:unnamed protein product [Phyllotreta striolata]